MLKLSKYIEAFDYIDKTLIVLSAKGGRISVISFTNVIGISTGLAIASFTSIFFNYSDNKEIVKSNKKEKEKT